jgi:hypothetical protein
VSSTITFTIDVPAPDPQATWARAIAASIALAFDDATLARIAGPLVNAVRGQLDEWAAAPTRDARAERIAHEVAALRAPVPPNWEHVHRDWIEHGLAWDPDAAVAWADPATGVTDAVSAWRLRGTTAAWVALPPIVDRDITVPADLASSSRDTLLAWLHACGLGVIAHVALDAGIEAVARLAAARGDGGSALVAVATTLRGSPGLRGQMGSTRRLASTGIDLAGDPAAIGARVATPHLIAAGGDVAWQVALRLPRKISAAIVEDRGIDGVGWDALIRIAAPA